MSNNSGYRELTYDESEYVHVVIAQFNAAIASIPGIRKSDFTFDGSDSDIVQLGYLFYEGIKIPLDEKKIDEACQFIMANALVLNHGFKWRMCVRRNESPAYSIIHERVGSAFVFGDIKSLVQLECLDGDEPDISDYVRAAFERLLYEAEWSIPPPPDV